MAEYIKREAAFNAVLKLVPKVDDDGYCWVIRGDAAKAVDAIPAADVAPVRHGRWVEVEVDKDDDGIPTLIMAGCDQCHFVSWTATPFCGYCGAKMDGGET